MLLLKDSSVINNINKGFKQRYLSKLENEKKFLSKRGKLLVNPFKQFSTLDNEQ